MKQFINSKVFTIGAMLGLAFIFILIVVMGFVGAAEFLQAVLRP